MEDGRWKMCCEMVEGRELLLLIEYEVQPLLAVEVEFTI
jgi:hypothetical protein